MFGLQDSESIFWEVEGRLDLLLFLVWGTSFATGSCVTLGWLL